MLISDEEDLRARHDGIQKMIAVSEFYGKLGPAVDCGVDFPAEAPLGLRQGLGESCHRYIADHHQVYVACLLLQAFGE